MTRELSADQARIVESFVNLPTAPFAEKAGLAYLREFVARRPALRARQDRFGNLLVHLRCGPKRRGRTPILFAAHLDHPGFVAERMIDNRTLHAAWRGWVRRDYFDGQRVRFWSEGEWRRGRIVEVIAGESDAAPQRANEAGSRRRPVPTGPAGTEARPTKRGEARPTQRGEVRPATRGGVRPAMSAPTSARTFGAESPPSAVRVRVERPIEPGAPGMWDFPDARIPRGGGRGGDADAVGGKGWHGGRNWLLQSRACDDVAGAAGILCMLDTLCRERVAGECYALFTRAEEVGFGGALAACDDGLVPENCLVVAIECSKAIAGVAVGGGPVLRVGDKATVFTPAATAFCQVVAEDLAKADPSFQFQRKLMDGGTCESTVYCHYGHAATGICLPLLNYHNMDTDRIRIAPEAIDVRDLANLVRWFVALVRTDRRYDGRHPGLDERLGALLKKHKPVLLQTRKDV